MSLDVYRKFEHHSKTYNVALPMSYILDEKPGQNVVLMIHGYYDKASSFYKRAFSTLTPNFSILAPNAPFPVPQLKQHEIKEGYSWYFYNYISHKMVVSPEASVQMLTSLVRDLNFENKKIVIVGFSQGGFLAPLVAEKLKNVKKVITIGAAYRDDFWNPPFHYSVDAIHGDQDEVISLERAQTTFAQIQSKGVQGSFHIVKNLSHTLNDEARSLLHEKIQEAFR